MFHSGACGFGRSSGLLRSLAACLAIFLAMPAMGKAATVAVGPSVYVWDFTLALWSTTTPSFDEVAVSYGQDRLDVGESLRVTLYGGTSSAFIHEKLHLPSTGSSNGFFWLYKSFADKFDAPVGSMVFELDGGSLDLRRITVILRWNNQRWGASITPGVTLIPEPGTCLLFLSGWLLVIRRSRPVSPAAHSFPAP